MGDIARAEWEMAGDDAFELGDGTMNGEFGFERGSGDCPRVLTSRCGSFGWWCLLICNGATGERPFKIGTERWMLVFGKEIDGAFSPDGPRCPKLVGGDAGDRGAVEAEAVWAAVIGLWPWLRELRFTELTVDDTLAAAPWLMIVVPV